MGAMDNEELRLTTEEELLLSTAFDEDLHISLSRSYESDVENLQERKYQEELLKRINFNQRQLNHKRIAGSSQSRESASSTDSGSNALPPLPYVEHMHGDDPGSGRAACGGHGVRGGHGAHGGGHGARVDVNALLQRDSLDYASGEEESTTDTDAEEQAVVGFVDGGADDISEDGLGFENDFIRDASTPLQRNHDSVHLSESQGDTSEFGSSDEIMPRSANPDGQNEHARKMRGAHLGPTEKVASFSKVKFAESELKYSLSVDENQQQQVAQRLGTPYHAEHKEEARVIERHEGPEDPRDRRHQKREVARNSRNKLPEIVRDGEPRREKEHLLVEEHTAEESDEYYLNGVKQDPLPSAPRRKRNRSKPPERMAVTDQGRHDKSVEFPSRTGIAARDVESSRRVTLKHRSKIPVLMPEHRDHSEGEEYESLHSAMQEEYNNMLLRAAAQKPPGDGFAEHPKQIHSLHRNNEATAQSAVHDKEQTDDRDQVTIRDKTVNPAPPHFSEQRKDILEANKQNLGRRPQKQSSYLQMHRRQCGDPAKRKLLWKRQEEQSAATTTALRSIHSDAQEEAEFPSPGAFPVHRKPESTNQHYNFSQLLPSNADGRHQFPGQLPAQSHRAVATRSSPADEIHAGMNPALQYRQWGDASAELGQIPIGLQHRPLYGPMQGVFLDNAGHAYTYSQVPGYVPGQPVFPFVAHDETWPSNPSRDVQPRGTALDAGGELWTHGTTGGAWPGRARILHPVPYDALPDWDAPCLAEQQQHEDLALHARTSPLVTRCNSDGCLDRLQTQLKNYKLEKIRKQQNYAKLVQEQNRSLLGRRGTRAPVHPTSAPEGDSKSRREQALEYARNVPRPRYREARGEASAPHGERRDSPTSSTALDPMQALLDDLRQRHEQDKQAVAAFRLHAP
ncbi:jhy protein homolog isoform X2 [Lethenteron reissneri]|uniref:jhy protein homolog isoform X2 n=1 Tax=Lethenteron reissneri TaxID=7753 RepID=UPI002AB67B51|nr:jhy protein homolog isoform X2 [Lethenteron reissneri]